MTTKDMLLLSVAALALTGLPTSPALADDDAVIKERTVEEERRGVEIGAPIVRERTVVPPAAVVERRKETEKRVVTDDDDDRDVDVDVDVDHED